jgi:hypothetical protein
VSAQGSEAVQEAVAFPEPEAAAQGAEARGRAGSLPVALSPAEEDAPARDAASLARERALRLGGWLAAQSRTSLLHAKPPSVAEIHGHHRQAAAAHQGGLLRGPRHVWGVMHTGAYAFALAALWVVFSPLGFVIAAAFLAACWFWL